jgi:putative redox protein
MFAERHRWPLEKVHVELSHAKAHAADCANCTAPSARLDRVDLTIRFEGTLSDEQRSKLMDVAMHCPLHRTLAAGLEIDEREA